MASNDTTLEWAALCAADALLTDARNIEDRDG